MPHPRSTRQHVGNLLGALSLAVADRMHAAVGSVAAVGPSAPAALAALHEFLDGGTVTQLSSVLGLTHSGTVRLVDRLAAEGLVERAGAPDGRTVAVVLTIAGRVTAGRVLAARHAALAATMSSLSADDVEQLSALLDTMLTTLTLARSEERAAGTDGAQPWLCRLCDLVACGRSGGHCPVNTAVSADGGT